MEDTTLFIILVAFLAVGAIGTLVMKSKLSKKGILAPSNFLANALTIVTGCSFVFVVMLILNPILQFEDLGSEAWLLWLIFGVLFVVGGFSLYTINKKANMSNGEAILLTVFESIWGLLILIIFILKLAVSFIPIVMGGSSSNKGSGSFSVLSNLDKTYQENARKHNEALKEQRNEEAEAHARSMGFDSANEAASYGMGPGREE